MVYRQCLNCGQFFEVSDEKSTQPYCSSHCFQHYNRCQVCGDYVETKETTIDSFICSEDCMKKYKFDRATRQVHEE